MSGRSAHLIRRSRAILLLATLATGWARPSAGVILWSDLGATLAHDTGVGSDILGGALKRDDSASDILYFKFHVEPLSDAGTEEYLAAFQFYEGAVERLGVGNSLKAWAYSAFNTTTNGEFNKVFGDMDLRSSQPESSSPGVFLPYELPRRGIERTFVFKVQYVPGGDDLVTVWLNPDLGQGATEAGQPASLTTTFSANVSFNAIHLRHEGGGGGWTFSDMEIATAFADFVSPGTREPSGATPGASGAGPTLTFRSWQKEQGLPQNAVRALLQTRDGYLWLGNDEGVARFDGVRFVSFGLHEGVGSGPVRALLEDREGALWIGTDSSGLTRRQGGRFTTFTKQDGLPADSITALAEDREGRLWVGTEAGLACRQDGRFAIPGPAEMFRGMRISFLTRDRQQVLWVGVIGGGVFRLEAGRFSALTAEGVGGLLQNPHCLLLDKADRIWVGASDDYVLCLEGEQWRRHRIPRHLARPYVKALAEEPDGTVWAGSVSEGLFYFKEGKLGTINASSGLLDNAVECLLVDRESNLWVGTGGGLSRLRRSSLLVLGQNEKLGYGPVQGLAEVAPGVVWAGKPNDGLYQWEGRSFSRVAVPALAGRRYPEALSLLVTRDGNCWMSGAGGVWRFTNPRQAPGEVELLALPGLNVTALAEDPDGSLWAGTREGQVWRLRQGDWLGLTNYWQSVAITAVLPGDGAMWIGTEGDGLHRYQKGSRTVLKKGSGLLSNWIRTLHKDAAGTVWIGTAGGGLSRWQDGHVDTLTTREGLPDNTISQILEDEAGRLWLGSSRGIACVNKGEVDSVAAGKLPAVSPQIYSRAQGMPSEECTGGYYPTGLRTKSGRLCFSTLKGVVVATPRSQTAEAPAPAAVLEQIVIDGVVAEVNPGEASGGERRLVKPGAIAGQPEVRVAPGKHRLEFRFTAMKFSAPERVRFRHRLEPLETGWVEAGGRRTALYNYVPPGQYRFRVVAGNSGGSWNEEGASLLLIVLPHFWQTWWFLGLASLALLASVGGGARIVEKRKHQRRVKLLEQERALERERARIAQDLHDDLGSSLTRISLLGDLARSEKDNPSQVEAHAQKITHAAGQSVRALEEIVWALRPGGDSVQSLVEYIVHFANELFEEASARCRLDLPPDLPARSLPPEMRHNIFLVVKEALTNALKHSQAREVIVQALATAQTLEFVVQDDGQGFEAQTLPAMPGKRHGLGNMRQRAADMGGTLEVRSVPGKGTTIRLKVSFPA